MRKGRNYPPRREHSKVRRQLRQDFPKGREVQIQKVAAISVHSGSEFFRSAALLNKEHLIRNKYSYNNVFQYKYRNQKYYCDDRQYNIEDSFKYWINFHNIPNLIFGGNMPLPCPCVFQCLCQRRICFPPEHFFCFACVCPYFGDIAATPTDIGVIEF